MAPLPLPAKRHPRTTAWRLASAACGLAATTFLLACSQGGPTDFSGLATSSGAGATYFRARITVLDTNASCDPAVYCPPEFYDCTSGAPIMVGDTIDVDADSAAAGLLPLPIDPTLPLTAPITLRMSGTDSGHATAASVAIKVESLTDFSTAHLPGTGGCTIDTSLDPLVFVDLNLACATSNHRFGTPESRFEFVRFNGSAPCDSAIGLNGSPTLNQGVTLAEFPTDGTQVLPAVRQGGTFSPTGIASGTFHFLAEGFEDGIPNQTGALLVQVDGCFRVNVPRETGAVPVTATASGPGCP